MAKVVQFLKDRFHQEGTLIFIVSAGLLFFLFTRTTQKQVNKPDFTGANLTGAHIDFSNKITKRFTPFVEGFGGVSSNGDKRAEVGLRAGVRVEF